jgi:hypothetical protein
MTWDELVEAALALPGVELSTSYGTPALKVRGKFLTRLRTEDGSIVLRMDFDTRELMLAEEPELFHITPHYAGYPAVLLRLASAPPGLAVAHIERLWRDSAPKALVRTFDAQKGDGSPSTP